MRLESSDGLGDLEMTIAGYESPDDLSELITANWLEIDVRVRTPHGWGTSRVACVHTWGAAGLADWLDVLGARRSVSTYMLFPEPNLQFRVDAQTAQDVTFHVRFILERPGEWRMDDALGAPDADSRNYIGDMDIQVPRTALHIAAESLRDELRNFPVREVKA